MRTIIDILLAIALLVLVLWCGLIAWGAYSQHNQAITINSSVLREMKDVIIAQSKDTLPSLDAKSAQEIERLELAQGKLLDANTSSFIYQFVTLIILTIGIAVMAWMYSQYRREQERADKAEKERIELISTLAPFTLGQNTCVIIASKYSLIYTLCRLYPQTSGSERDSSLLMMADFQNDILRHLEYALREKEGLEPLWHELILDLAEKVKQMLLLFKVEACDSEKTTVERVLSISLKCYDVLWSNGKEFEEYYNSNLIKITGKLPPSRQSE